MSNILSKDKTAKREEKRERDFFHTFVNLFLKIKNVTEFNCSVTFLIGFNCIVKKNQRIET